MCFSITFPDNLQGEWCIEPTGANVHLLNMTLAGDVTYVLTRRLRDHLTIVLLPKSSRPTKTGVSSYSSAG